MTDGDIIDMALEYVRELLSDKPPNNIGFHNVMDTEVVKAVIEIAGDVIYRNTNRDSDADCLVPRWWLYNHFYQPRRQP